MKKGIHIVNLKMPKKVCHREFVSFFLTKSGKKSLTMFISSCFNNYQLIFEK